MRSVLVTGATTPLGRALIEGFLAHGVGRIIAVGHEPAEAWTGVDDDRCSYVSADLARPREVRELIYGPARAHAVDTIIHGALRRSASKVGRRVHRLEVEATRLILRLAEDIGVTGFVYRSHAEVYAVQPDSPTIIREDHALNLSPRAPQWIRDRVEADLTACAAMGLGATRVAVLRTAEIFAPECGSQIWDYLSAPLCLRPLGYDPMINLLSIEDAVGAIVGAARDEAQGVFNIPGADTLPLSAAIHRSGRPIVPLPSPLMGPLYQLRRLVAQSDFRWDLNHWRFHQSAILDGTRAARELGYTPKTRVKWPEPRR